MIGSGTSEKLTPLSVGEWSRMRFHLYEHKSCDDDGDGRYVQGALMLMDKQWRQQEIVKQEQQ